MSPPAMIDSRSPPASSAHRFPFGNPSKGQIPTPPALDQSTMDPAPPSTSGLSKPRLVKVRKQAASPRVRPPSAPDRPPLAGFNPFPASSADVRDRLYGWKPFVAEAGNISVSNSIGASSNSVNSVKPGSANFVFGASTKTDGLVSSVGGGFDDQLMSRLPDEIGKLNLQSGSTETSRKDTFVFGSSVKDGSNLSRSASLGADDGSGSLSWLPDGISKMKLSGGNEGLERIHQAEGKTSVIGGSKKTSNEGVRNPDPGVSVFGSGRTNFQQRGLDGDLLTRLPNEMKELNLQSTDSQHDMSTDGSFVFGGSKAANGERAQSSDPSTFIFGSGVKIGSSLSGNSSFGGSDEGSFTQLPDEMRKHNFQNAGKKHDFQKTKSTSAKFGISENVPNFSGNGVANKLTDDMVKLKIRNEAAARDKKDGLDCSAGIFVPGSNSKASPSPTTFSTSLDKGMTSDLPNDPKKWDGQGLRHDFDSRNARESETGDRVDLGPDFVFGNSNSASVTCGGTAGKYNLGNRSENLVSGKQHVFRTDGSRTTEPSSFKFTFQAGKQDCSSNTGFIPQLRTHENINPAPVVKSSCFASSPAPSVESGFTSKSTQEGFGTSQFRIPKQDAFCFSEENLCANLRQSMAFSMKEEAKGTKTRKRRGKSRQRAPVAKQSSLKENVTLENSEHESVGGYSPMDYSPYHENIVADQCSAETSVASDESFHLSYRCSSNDSHISSSMDGMNEKSSVSVDGTEESLASAAQHMSINGDDVKYGKLNEAGPKESVERNFSSGFSFAEKTSELGNLCLPTESESARFDNDKRVAPERNFSSEFSFVEKTSELGNSSLPTEHESARFDNDKRTAAERNFSSGISFVERTSELGNSSLPTTEYESVRLDNDKRTASFEVETAGTFTSNNTKEAGEGRSSFTFASRLEDYSNSNLTFVTSPAKQGPLSASKHRYRRKSRPRTVQDSYNCTANDKVPLASASPRWFPVASSSVDPDPQQGTTNILFNLKTKNENRVEKNIKPDAIQDPVTNVSASIAAKEACEKWRLRGNQAYANGLLSKAEEYYTRGVNSIPLNETSKSCIQALMLCHSNRAATRMSLGRMREAIGDCKIALAIDPNFLRAQVRTGNCYLALGEIEEALKHFKKCLQSDSGVNCDKKILSEASEGLKKAQQVGDCMDRSIEFLLKRNRNDATNALQILSEALLISPNSESLLEMKAEALLMARSYEEVIQMCEQTLDSSEKNSVVTGDKMQLKGVNNSENPKVSPERLWRWRLISMSYFYLGKFEEALELLQKHEKVEPIAGRFCNNSQEPPRKLSVTISELLRLKAAGNEAFQSGKHLEAIEHYTSALACNTESRSFTAICFCNRAAAYQALDQITYAIADCSLAIALNSSYPKAISRRATLYEMIRDYGQAVNDLNRLISLLEKQSEDGDIISGETVRSSRNCNDLKRARMRLSAMEEEARKGIPLDMYMILGVERTSSAADVKKAYRKAALRHHPDKAGHYLTRSENINDGLWREVAVEVHTDADRLFKMIGEAYAILSDSVKRQQYDEEEEMRKSIQKKGYTPRSRGDGYGSQYERGFERRQWQPYGNSHHRWSESSYSDW